MQITRWPVLTAFAALIASGGHLSAGDLYDKSPAKTDALVLPKPAEVQSLTCYPAKISLLGFEPEVDYAALVKEARGRRLMPSAPDYSLLLLKATGKMAHGGGKKLDSDSDEYKLIRRWIAAGMPFGKPTDPVVSKISI